MRVVLSALYKFTSITWWVGTTPHSSPLRGQHYIALRYAALEPHSALRYAARRPRASSTVLDDPVRFSSPAQTRTAYTTIYIVLASGGG